MRHRNLWREIKNSSRRTGKQFRRKIRTARPFGIAIMVFVLFILMLRLVGGMAGKLWPYMAGMLAEVGEHSGKAMLLEDKVLFRYLFYEEKDRGSFRIFSESVLNGRLYLTAASTGQAGPNTGQVDPSTDQTGLSTDQAGPSTNQAGSSTGQASSSTGQASSSGQAKEESPMPVVVEEGLAQSVLSENTSWEEGQRNESILDNLAWEDGFLENVLSENASFGNQAEGDDFSDISVEAGKKDSIFSVSIPEEEYLPVVYLPGNVAPLEKPPLAVVENTPAPIQETIPRTKILLENNYSLSELSNVDHLLSTYYIVDSITSTLPELFDAEKLLAMDFTLGQQEKSEDGKYQILIYHTHASEEYIDSRDGEVLDTVRGPGEALAEYLRGYGYTVYHDMTAYDRKDGKDNRNMAYSTARPQIEAFLEQHPEVEVIIDLHRDSGAKRVATVDGKKTAQIMLFNGLCRNASGPIADLENPNLPENLGFSLQLNLTGRVMYPNLMFRIYLKNYRYNQHFRPRCLLVELGTDQNTVEEAYNAMKPFAAILDAVLGE